jgi:hypothetical protein
MRVLVHARQNGRGLVGGNMGRQDGTGQEGKEDRTGLSRHVMQAGHAARTCKHGMLARHTGKTYRQVMWV